MFNLSWKSYLEEIEGVEDLRDEHVWDALDGDADIAEAVSNLRIFQFKFTLDAFWQCVMDGLETLLRIEHYRCEALVGVIELELDESVFEGLWNS